MSNPTSSQAQPPRKKNRDGRLSGSLLSLNLVRLRGDGGATFHSPQNVVYSQVGKGKGGFVDLDEATSLYPTLADIPLYLLPSPEALEKVKTCKGEVARCPFCPSTFSGIVVKRSFKRHLQRHWNHATAEKLKDQDQPGIAPSLASPVAGVQQSPHALPTSIPTPLITLPDLPPALGPPISPKRHPTPTMPTTSKAPANKRTRKSITTSTLGTVCKDSATVAIARALEVLHSKPGMVFYSPDAYPLEHRLFTQREEQFLDVDATFSTYPTIDQLPQSFWPTQVQYTTAAAGGHRLRCLFCSWSFTGVHVKANFRGHVRYHWKLAAALQKANSSAASTDIRHSPDTPASPYGPSKSPLVAETLITSSNGLWPDDAGPSKSAIVQPSPPSEIRSTQNDQIAASGSIVTKLEAGRPQERKRSHSEAFSEDDASRRESVPAKHIKECAKPPSHSVLRSIMSSIRIKPGTTLVPPEQSMSYEELVLIVDRYFDMDKTVSLYPLVDQLPDRFWPTDETFKKAEANKESGRVRCPFCTSSFKGRAAKRNMQTHVRGHWWRVSGQSGLAAPGGIIAANIESFHTTYTGSSPNLTPNQPSSSIRSTLQPNTNPEKVQSIITRTYTDTEVNHGNHGTRQAMGTQSESTISAQRGQGLVCSRVL